MIQITITQIKQYYPVTDSLQQTKINDYTNFVKHNIFVAMFGLAISNEIFNGTIVNSKNVDFVGFTNLVAICVANELIKNLTVHTNAGLKIVNQPNWQALNVAQKQTKVNDLSGLIENQFLEAKKVLVTLGKITTNKFQNYGSFKIEKL